MVRAVAKSGSRAGKPLWRCSDFDCPTLINIDDPDRQPALMPAAGTSAQAEYERERAEYGARLRSGAVFLVAAAVFVTLLAFFVGLALMADVRVAAGVAVGVLIGLAWYFLRFLPNDVVYWRRGAEAEHAIGAKLDGLERLGFITLYDRRVPGRGGNIDAVTVGPPGVFVVEVKHRGRAVEVFLGELEVGGRAQSEPVRQVLELAMLVQISIAQAMNRHRLTVIPIIAIGNRRVSGGERAGGVLVLDVQSIADRLAAEPTVLSEDDVRELASLLDQALPPYERRRG